MLDKMKNSDIDKNNFIVFVTNECNKNDCTVMMKCPLVTIIALALMTFSMNAKDKYPYQNAGLPVEQRVAAKK